jgi:two-component sensor histidine kinase
MKLLLSALLLVCFWARPSLAGPETVLLDPEISSYTIGPHAHVFADETRTMTFEQIRAVKRQGGFSPETQELPNYGFTGHAYWFHFSAVTVPGRSTPWFVAVEYPLIDKIALYYQKEGRWVRVVSGDQTPFSQRGLKNRYFYFPIHLHTDRPTEFYLRMQTDGSSEFRMFFKTLHQIMSEDHESQYYQGIFVGLMAVMIAYYAFLGIGSRSREYFLLALFLGALLFFKMAINGLAYEYLWPSSVWWGNKASVFSVPFVFLCTCLYASSFLPVEEHPRIRKIYMGHIAILSMATLGSFVLPYIFIKVYTIIGLSVIILVLTSSTYILVNGYKPARFFLMAWLALLMGSFAYGTQKLGLLPVSFWTINGIELATASLVVLLAIGSSDKINQINLQIRRAQKEALVAQIEARQVTETMNTKLEQQVRERTEELWQQTRDVTVMLDHIQQGLCMVDAEGCIQKQYSPYLERILDKNDLAGKSLFNLLFERSDMNSEQLSVLHSILDMSMSQDTLNFDTNSHLLPSKVTFESRLGTRYLEVEWAAIEDAEERVLRVLVAIRDVTEMKQAEDAAAARQHELEVIGRILEMSASKFKRFLSSAWHLLHDSYSIIKGTRPAEQWPSVLRNIHTIKGNARTYGLEDISHLVHEVETVIFAMDKTRLTTEQIASALGALQKVEQIIRFYETMHDSKLKRAAFADLEVAMVRLTTLMSEYWNELPQKLQNELADILQRIDELNVNTFQRVLKSVAASLGPLSQQLKKKAPSVLIQGEDFLLDPDQLEMFEDIFVHLFRNSLDHGFDADQKGTIVVSISHVQGSTQIAYRDDGKGLNLSALRKKTIEKGLLAADASDEEVAYSIFLSGVSSASQVTEISGRGVGMEAVQAFVQRLQGSVTIQLEEATEGSQFRRFTLMFRMSAQRSLPKKMHMKIVS